MLALVNAKIILDSETILEKGTILIEDSKISAVGEDIEIPANTEIIDAAGKWITPGFIDCHTHPNMTENPGTQDMCDANESSGPITPQMHIEDAINPAHPVFDWMREGGFTVGYALPGSANIVAGTGIAYKTKPGNILWDKIIPGTRQMKMAMGENPKRFYGKKGQCPVTRMGTAYLLRKALEDAKAYAETQKDENSKRNIQMEDLALVVQGKMRCRVHAHRADDIVNAWRIGQEYNLDMIIEHATDARSIKDYIKENNIPVVVGPFMPLYFRTKQECWNLSDETPKVLAEAGIPFAATKDGCEDIPYLRTDLGICIAKGLPWKKAFEALTIEPAKILQLEDRLGTLAPGKDADLAIWNGDPFCNYTLCEKTIIDGIVYENL